MSINHTPWTIQEVGRYSVGLKEHIRDFAIRDRRNICVALVGTVDAATKDDNMDHARLIAAAPDLLAALKAVLTGSTRAMGVDSTDAEYAHIRVASLDMVRKAIAKVEG